MFARVENDGGIVAAPDSLTTFENLVAFARSNLGQDFDLVAFHRALLTAGAVPLTLLDDVADRYIAAAQASP